MPRLRARAPRGQRAVGAAPRNRGPNVTLLATLTPTGVDAPCVIEGGTDRHVFTAYVDQVLVPTLRPGQTVILDNLNVHKGRHLQQRVEAAGCHLRFLPTYSPDFNPIEPAFAKVKAHLRRAAARTRDGLLAATGAALDAVTRQDARGFFAHCGYPLRDHSFRNRV